MIYTNLFPEYFLNLKNNNTIQYTKRKTCRKFFDKSAPDWPNITYIIGVNVNSTTSLLVNAKLTQIMNLEVAITKPKKVEQLIVAVTCAPTVFVYST